jgi:hypothetical protein
MPTFPTQPAAFTWKVRVLRSVYAAYRLRTNRIDLLLQHLFQEFIGGDRIILLQCTQRLTR